MTRTPWPHQLAGLAALEATVEIAMRALVETYRELHREPRLDDSAEAVTAARLVDQCGLLLAALDAHRRVLRSSGHSSA
jgi:D-serine deaminase-like pyridoxal phosphate-dependent protein